MMSDSFRKINCWLGRNMFLVVLTGLLLGFMLKLPNTALLRKLVVLLFAYMTFITALGTSLKRFANTLRTPWLPLWILILVHIATPFTAWLAGISFYPDDHYIRIGYLIGATIPIGVTSIIWTALVKGDMAVSLVAVTLDTFLVPIILPVFFKFVAGKIIPVSYFDMTLDLVLMITLPSIAGMLMHDLTKGRIVGFSQSIGGATAKLSLLAVILINAALVAPQITWDAAMLKLLLVTLLIVASGYFVGYLGSFILKERSPEKVLTLVYNVGIRNNASGLVLALAYFPPAAAIPITLAILYQQPLATIIPYLYKRFVKHPAPAN